MPSAHLTNWIPYKLTGTTGQYSCEWLYTGNEEYIEPFFSETIAKCRLMAINSKPFRATSSLHVLPLWCTDMESIAPTAFIFHISRCGSTLIAQSLGLNPQHIVLAEVPFVDSVLRLTRADGLGDNAAIAAIIKATFNFYGQNRNGVKNKLFVKTDSWHAHFMPLLRKLYPHTPFILLYRQPDEVIRSHQKRRGMQAVQGVVPDHLLGIEPGITQNLTADEHMTKVMEAYMHAFISQAKHDPLMLLINYNQGIENIMKSFCSFTGILLNAEDRTQIQNRSRFNAKYPDQVFAEEQPDKAIPDYQVPAFKLYHQLEEIRIAPGTAQKMTF